MQSESKHAFKEWAVVCAALAAGRQSLLLRKGGIHERGGRFEVEHREFWLFPTRFHQNAEGIREEDHDLLQSVAADAPAAGVVPLSYYAVVEEVIEIRDESLLPRLADLQILNQGTVSERFHYRRPVLFVLPVRIYRRQSPILLAESPQFTGCRTWVDLEHAFSTFDLAPALPEVAHRAQIDAIRQAISVNPSRT